jgi:hypothetical protein
MDDAPLFALERLWSEKEINQLIPFFWGKSALK